MFFVRHARVTLFSQETLLLRENDGAMLNIGDCRTLRTSYELFCVCVCFDNLLRIELGVLVNQEKGIEFLAIKTTT